MKKYLLLFLPLLVFSYEIEFNKKFTKKLVPNILSANITISIEDSKEKFVIEKLEVFNKKIKEYTKLEKELGSFNIRPVYQHSSNTPKIDGYKGDLRYKISTQNAIFVGEFVSMITSLKEDRDTSVSLDDLSWKVKEDSLAIALDILRFESITWIENYTKVLSQDLNKECVVKSINLSNSAQALPYAVRQFRIDSSAQKNEILVPEISEQNISINTNYRLECK